MNILRPHTLGEIKLSEQNADPFGNIWITSRIRMDAHARYVGLDRLSHILLTVYSVALLGFSVFQPHLTNTPLGPFSSEISIVLSASILCASLVIWGLGFGQKAHEHRECYLALQRLYDAPMEEEEKRSAYRAILEKYPNHSDLENERFLFRKICIDGASISTASGPLKMGFARSLRYLSREIVSVTLKLILVFAPVIIVLAIYVTA